MSKYGMLVVAACLLLGMAMPVTAAPILNLQAGDQVKAVLVPPLVAPRVGGVTVEYNGQTYGSVGSDHVVGSNAIWAGIYQLDVFDLSDVQIADQYPTFCMDIVTSPVVGTPEVHDVVDSVPSAIKSMWATYHSAAMADPIAAAALQLAVWEVMHENPANSYDLGSGSFLLYGLDTADVDNHGATLAGLISQANSYLNPANWTGSAQLLELYREGKQPFLVEVPEPATLLLLGFGAVALIRKRLA